ncbi:MAG: DMT family transporter [Balneolaceae bacterium]
MPESPNSADYPKFKIISLLFIGLITFGASPILVRYATDVQPMVLAALRTLIAVGFLAPFWLVRKKTFSELKTSGVNPVMMMLAGISLGLHFSFWIASLHYTSVASATVLVTIHPVIIILTESLLYKKRFGSTVWLGVFMACMGSIALGFSDRTAEGAFENPLLGNAFAFTAAVIFVIYFMMGRKIRQKAEWIDYVFHVYLHAAITCSVLTLIWVGGWPYISFSAVLISIALAAGPTIIGHGSMNYAVKYVSPTILSTLILSEVIIAAIAAFFLFDELPSPVSMGAMLIIMTGVSLSWLKK